MASLSKKPTAVKKEPLTEKELAAPLHSPENKVLCDCGQPVATELGQNQVCKKHMRAK
jgi:hypothetical protein